MLARAEAGRHAKSFMLIGLRGVGKTVLLNRIFRMAQDRRFRALLVEAHEDKPLPELLLPPLRQILLGLDQMGKLNETVKRGLRILKGFAKSIKIKYGGIEVGLGIDPERGVGDSGDLESDLPDVLTAVGEAAKARTTVVVLLIDELQYLDEDELSALIMGMHRVSQRQLPLVLVGAGLPQLVGNMGRSKSYAERLFEFPVVGPLSKKDAAVAIIEPIRSEGERMARTAVELTCHGGTRPGTPSVGGHFGCASGEGSERCADAQQPHQEGNGSIALPMVTQPLPCHSSTNSSNVRFPD
jgi:hypothetical protein